MKNLILIGPELFLAVVALGILLGDAFTKDLKKPWLYISVGALALAGLSYILFFTNKALPGAAALGIEPISVTGSWIQYSPVINMISVDSLAVFFKISVVAAVIIVFWLSADYPEYKSLSFATYSALLLLATVGMLLLVGCTDLLLAVISVELLSISSFILTGYIVTRRSSGEAAIKYFLVGGLSTALLLFGISYYYGYFGTTSILPLLAFNGAQQTIDSGLSLILIFLVSGLGFKLAMVPFHMWAPDAYEGAPTPITAFLSVAPKAAAVGFIIRLFAHHGSLGFTPVLAVLAALTMSVGNMGALPQTNLKRLLAYSSIAQIGYILVALVAGGTAGVQAAMIYTFIYLFMNLGVFSVLIIVANTSKSEELDTFAGLSKRSFPLALIMMLLLLSMTGIPPLAGFIGKFSVFSAVITDPSLLWLGIIAILNSVVSLYYYFKVAQQMFFKEAIQTQPLEFTPALLSCLVVTVGVTVVAGLLPNQLLGWVRNLVGS